MGSPWEQREFRKITERRSATDDDPSLLNVEYEDIIPEIGELNKSLMDKPGGKKGIKFEAGDVLYGKLRPYLHNWLLPSFSGLAVGDFWVLKTDKVDSGFLYRLIQTQAFDQIANQSTGTKMPRADWKKVSSSEFFIPYLMEEQQQIGAFFQKLDDSIALQQRKLDLLKEKKKGYLQKMFPKSGQQYPEYRFAGFTDPWEQRKAGEVFVSINEKGYPELPVLSATQDRGMVIRNEAGYQFQHDTNSEKGYKRVEPGDFVIHLRSFQGGFAHSSVLGIASPAYTVFRFRDGEQQDDLFWKRIFLSSNFIKRLETVTYGIRDGRSISYPEFLKMGFLVPSINEQKAISRYFDHLDDTIALQQRKLDLLKEKKKAYLQKMFPADGENEPKWRFKEFA